MKRRPLLGFIILSGLALGLGLAGLCADLYPFRLAAGLLLAGFVPGYGLTGLVLINRGPLTWLVRGFGAVGASYAISTVALMSLSYLAGAVTPAGILLAFGFVLTLLAGLAWRRGGWLTSGEVAKPFPDLFVAGLLGLLAVAAFLRLWGIQYSDLQGDEAEVLFRAATLIGGAENSLLTHSKGPAEILITAAFGALTGRLDEFTVRLPFALASASGVAGAALLGRQLFGSTAGLVAGGLLAINGVLVTYARTAQYQSLLVLFSVWAAWFFYDYYRGGRLAALLSGAFLLSAAFLTHFEAILLVPLPVFLVWRRLRLGEARWHREWPPLAAAAGLMGIIVAAFYLPAALNPQLGQTGSYLAQRVGSGLPYNNFPLLYISTLTYNAYYYLLLSIALLGAALLIALKRAWACSNRQFVLGLLAICGLAAISGWFFPSIQPIYLLALSAVGAGLLGLSPRLPETVRALVIWGAPAWLAYLFLVARPGNHYYVFFPAAALLAGWGLEEALRRLRAGQSPLGRLWAPGTLGLILAAGFVICAYYEYLLVARNDLEYILTYPRHRQPFFVTDANFPFKTRIGFGFPYRLGWQMVGRLYRTGELAGDWGGNDQGNSPDWYTLRASRTDCYPRNVMMAEITYKEDYPPLPFDLEASGYTLRYRIWDNDQLRMQVYTFDPLGEFSGPQDLVEPAWYPTPVTIGALRLRSPVPPEAGVTTLEPPERFSLTAQTKTQLAAVIDPRLTEVQDSLELVGYQLDETWSQPGGAVLITLYWRAVESVHLPFKIFVHLTGEQGAIQADDFPACGTFQTPHWKIGQLVADRHLLRLPPDVAPGRYRLEVGIYEPQTGLRLDRLDIARNPAGNSLQLVEVAVRP